MNRLLLILLLCSGIVKTSRAQQFFNVRDAFNSVTSILTSVVTYNQKYYCTGVCIDSINYIGNGQMNMISGIKFAVFDQNGSKLQDTVYQKQLSNIDPWSNNLQMLNDKTLLLAAEQFDTGQVQKILLVRFDTLGNVIWDKEIAKPLCISYNDFWIKVVDLREGEGGNWLMLSRISCHVTATTSQVDLLLTKFNSNFDVIWHKSYGSANLDDGGWKILPEHDGYLIAGGRHNLRHIDKNFTLRALLMKVDTGGVVQWEWQSNASEKIFEAKDVIRTKDKGYVYCGQGDGYEVLSANGQYSIPAFRAWVEKLDSNRNVVWSKSFGEYYYRTEFKKIIESPDGRLFLFGDRYMPDSLGPTSWMVNTRGWFLTLGSNGDSLMERSYYNLYTCDNRNLIYDVKQTDDGGFVMVGEATDRCSGFSAPSQRGWIVKVDSNGCLGPGDPQCWPVTVPANVLQPAVTVYPNPVKDYWYIRNERSSFIKVSIIDLTGKVLLQTESNSSLTLDLNGWSSGIYLYNIVGANGYRIQGKLLKN